MYNLKNLTGKDIAERFASEFFSEEEKEALKITRGRTVIDVKDQFLMYYGTKKLVWDEETTLKKLGMEIEENIDLLDEIRTLKEKIREIRKPQNYDEINKTQAEGTDTTDSKTALDSASVSANTSESFSESFTKNLSRNLQTQTSKLMKNVEDWDKGRQLAPVQVRKRKKLNTEKALQFETSELWTEVTDTVARPEPFVNHAYPAYNDIGMVVGNDQNTISSYSTDDALNTSKTKTIGEAKVVREGTSVATKSISGENFLKTLTVEIPKIRHKFWSKFSYLFWDNVYCS